MVSEASKATAVAAGLALLASLEGVQMPDQCSYTSPKHKPITGRVVGWDNGKTRKRQPRNQPCECGSGLKAKRCCVFQKREEVADGKHS